MWNSVLTTKLLLTGDRSAASNAELHFDLFVTALFLMVVGRDGKVVEI